MQDDQSSTDNVDTGADIEDVSLDLMNAEEPTDSTETSPAEDKTAEEEASDEEQEQTPDKPDETDSTEEESEDTEKTDLKSMNRRERAEYFAEQKRQQLADIAERRQIEQAYTQAYQPQDVTELAQQYLDAGYTEGEALMLARQDAADQKAQIAEATASVAELNANLRVDAYEARNTYDWMNPDKKDTYDKVAHETTSKLYESMITVDERTGQIVEAKMTPSQLAGIIDQIRSSGMQVASLKAQKAAEQEMAAVAPPTSTTTQRDPNFADLSPEQMREQLFAKGHVF